MLKKGYGVVIFNNSQDMSMCKETCLTDTSWFFWEQFKWEQF